ncbi:hypothetical protein ES708_15719 [subsurface metagenome]
MVFDFIAASLSLLDIKALTTPKKMKNSMAEDKIIPTTVASKYLRKLFMVYDFDYYWTKINLFFSFTKHRNF